MGLIQQGPRSCDKVIVAIAEYQARVIVDEWQGMRVEVPVHRITTPTPENTNAVGIDSSK